MSNNGLLGNPRVAGKPLASPLYTNLSANKILAPSDTMKTIRIGITNGYGIYLPNATLLQGRNRQVILKNTQSITVKVYDNSGKQLVTLAPFAQGLFWCTDVTTIAGSWTITNTVLEQTLNNAYGVFTGIIDSYAIALCPLTSDKVVAIYTQNYYPNNGINSYAQVLTINSDNTMSVGTNLSLGQYFGYSTIGVDCLSSSSLIVCLTNGNYNGSAFVLTVTGTTLTMGALHTFAPNDGSNYVNYISVCALDSTKAIVCYKQTGGYIRANVLTISGTSISVGTNMLVVSEAGFNTSIAKLLNNSAIISCNGASNYFKSVVVTVSGTSITVGTLTTVNPNYTYYTSTCALSSTKALVGYLDATNNYSMCLNVLSINGTTITVGATYTFEQSSGYLNLCAIDEQTAMICYRYAATAVGVRTLIIDGLTISASGISSAMAYNADTQTDVVKLDASRGVVLFKASAQSHLARSVTISKSVY